MQRILQRTVHILLEETDNEKYNIIMGQMVLKQQRKNKSEKGDRECRDAEVRKMAV